MDSEKTLPEIRKSREEQPDLMSKGRTKNSLQEKWKGFQVRMLSMILICVIYIITALTGMMLIKAGYSAVPLFHIPLLGVGISFRTILGILLYGVSFLIYVLFVTRLKISIAIPVVSGIYCALTVVVGMFFFHEEVSFGQIIGISLILAGTVLVGLMSRTGK